MVSPPVPSHPNSQSSPPITHKFPVTYTILEYIFFPILLLTIMCVPSTTYENKKVQHTYEILWRWSRNQDSNIAYNGNLYLYNNYMLCPWYARTYIGAITQITRASVRAIILLRTYFHSIREIMVYYQLSRRFCSQFNTFLRLSYFYTGHMLNFLVNPIKTIRQLMHWRNPVKTTIKITRFPHNIEPLWIQAQQFCRHGICSVLQFLNILNNKTTFKFYFSTDDPHWNNIPTEILPQREEKVPHFTHTMFPAIKDTDFVFAAHSFHPELSQVLTDNCATGHIFKDASYFIGDMIDISATICGIGTEISTKMGTVNFTITDNKEKVHNITLQNVMYLPSAHKNLLSISAWEQQYNDNVTVTSSGTSSTFNWGDNTFAKTYEHHPLCPVADMPINEKSDTFTNFCSANLAIFQTDTAFPAMNKIVENLEPVVEGAQEACPAPNKSNNIQQDETKSL